VGNGEEPLPTLPLRQFHRNPLQPALEALELQFRWARDLEAISSM